MDHRQLKDCALLIGYNPEGQCVYSAQLSLADYWDGDHVWDSGTESSQIRLSKVRGYLFGSSGELFQEFESISDPETGAFLSGWQRNGDGTYTESAA